MREHRAEERSAEQVLALLRDPAFCAEAQRTILEAAGIRARTSNPADGPQAGRTVGSGIPRALGVPAPTTSELLDADPRRRVVDAVASGRWSVVVVFERTQNTEIQRQVQQIRSVICKRHRDALVTRCAQLVQWLEACGFDRPTIAQVVFGRHSGLERPTKKQAIRMTSEERERALHHEYLNRGLSAKQIEQRVYRRLRGSEAVAGAAVRMAQRRYVENLERLNVDLTTPIESEPMSHALTLLFRVLDEDDATVRRAAMTVHDALRGAAGHLKISAEPRSAEALVSVSWGIVPIFPWTTDPEIRGSVTKIRAMLRAGPSSPARPNTLEPLGHALVSLVRAVADQDALGLDDLPRRHGRPSWGQVFRDHDAIAFVFGRGPKRG